MDESGVVLQGGYVEPGPGGDPIRNPGVLPTGKNIHALDPQSIPTQAAVKSARVVVERCACDMLLLGSPVLILYKGQSCSELLRYGRKC